MKTAFVLLLFLSGSAFAQVPAGGMWKRYAKTDKMDDSANVLFRVRATGTDSRSPAFSFLCTNGRMTGITYDAGVSLAVDGVNGDTARTIVRYRVDQNAPGATEWSHTDDGRMLVSLQSPFPPLSSAQTLMIRVGTLDGAIITDEFPIADLDADLFHQDCGR